MNSNNISIAERDIQNEMIGSHLNTQTKCNLLQIRKTPPYINKLKPSFMDSIQMMTHNSNKDVVTADNRVLA